MQPLLNAQQIHDADTYTIAHEPISSLDLMEHAAKAFEQAFTARYGDTEKSIAIYCGTGNNGGDGLAIARMLFQHGYQKVNVKIARFSDRSTEDFNANLVRLKATTVAVREINREEEFDEEKAEIIIGALLGTGLNK